MATLNYTNCLKFVALVYEEEATPVLNTKRWQQYLFFGNYFVDLFAVIDTNKGSDMLLFR